MEFHESKRMKTVLIKLKRITTVNGISGWSKYSKDGCLGMSGPLLTAPLNADMGLMAWNLV